MSLSITRRRLLSVLGLSAAAAVPVFRRGILHAAVALEPTKRFIAFKYNHGTQAERWFPQGAGTDFPLDVLPPLLEPFENVKSKLLVFKGLGLLNSQPGGSHNRGMHAFLTGATGGGERWAAAGISLDQYLVGELAPPTKFPSLQLAGGPNGTIAFSGPETPVPAQANPWQAYEQIFGELIAEQNPDTAAELARLREQRRSVLDHAADEITAITPQLGSEDRARLEVHLDAIRTVEQGLDAGAAEGCIIPSAPPPEEEPEKLGHLKGYEGVDIGYVTRLQIDIMVAALLCDLTRVSTFCFGSGAYFELQWMGIAEGLHSLSHEGPGNPDAYEKYFQALHYFSSEIAYFLERLDAVPGATDGTVLDESVVVVGTDNGNGKSHSVTNVPFLLAGSAGGYFDTGRYVEYPEHTAHNGLLLSICEAMGAPTETFGDVNLCSGPLPNLT